MSAWLAKLGDDYLRHVAHGDFASALAIARQALAVSPGNAGVLADAGFCLMRLEQYPQAYASYRKALQHGPDVVNTLDGMAELCGHMKRMDESRIHMRRSLTLKARQVSSLPARSLPAASAPMFHAAQRSRHVIAFSLFGENPRYCETAVLNARIADKHFPAWICRFYVDESVPADIVQRLLQLGSEVISVDADTRRGISPLMWRFLVAADPQVDRFMIRDADSLFSVREEVAVQAWLESGRWFHLMRDYFTHSELILAGMWAGCGGVFTDILADMRNFVAGQKRPSRRTIDQEYLRERVWPTLEQSVLVHDSISGLPGTVDFPPHPPHGLGDTFHVGGNAGSAVIGGEVGEGVSHVHWHVVDENGEEVCRYRTSVAGTRWSTGLPMEYAAAIRANRWTIEVMQTTPSDR